MVAVPTPVATPETIEDIETGTGDGLEARVVVYNCDCHTFEQVIRLFCEVIPGMNEARAFELAYRIHTQGQAVVYSGEWKTSEGIAQRLSAGGLKVAVQ